MSVLDDIRPTKNRRIFDLAEEAGLDMSDWTGSSNDPRGHKANPKYCFEWSFVEEGKVVILNLWHDSMSESQGVVIQRGNFREDYEKHRGPGGNPKWFQRGKKLDDALQTALKDNLPIRVIVITGDRRRPDGDTASKVQARRLDSEPWSISEYDFSTGAYELRRGIFEKDFVDQFDIEQAEKTNPEKRERTTSAYPRDPKIRDAVKRRSGGVCEYCGEIGFKMESGAIYLETHHIQPLSEGGKDAVGNVIALCPKDHRMAHFSCDATAMRAKMIEIVASKLKRRASEDQNVPGA